MQWSSVKRNTGRDKAGNNTNFQRVWNAENTALRQRKSLGNGRKKTLHGRIYHPQTQGKEESINRSMKKELLKYNTFANKSDAQRKFNEYREFYNNIRPHHALNLDTPAQHYCKSSRKYPDKISEWEYPKGYHLKEKHSYKRVTYRKLCKLIFQGIPHRSNRCKKRRVYI